MTVLIVPSIIAWKAPLVASTVMILTSSAGLRPASWSAWTAPRPISSFWAKTPWMSLLFLRKASMTALPLVESQSAVWLSVMVIPQAPIFSRKPLPRSMAAEEPTLPTSSTTFFLALPSSSLHISSAALRPSRVKSEPMYVA